MCHDRGNDADRRGFQSHSISVSNGGVTASCDKVCNRAGFRPYPQLTPRVRFSCVDDPTKLDFLPDNAIILTMKTQLTLLTLGCLRMAGLTDQPIFCAQIGVANERFALRRSAEVHGIVLRMSTFITASHDIVAFSEPPHRLLDIGLYPAGLTEQDHRLAETLTAANIAAFTSDAVMEWKYGKLLFNLHNILEAALSRYADASRLFAPVLAEGRENLSRCGINVQMDLVGLPHGRPFTTPFATSF